MVVKDVEGENQDIILEKLVYNIVHGCGGAKLHITLETRFFSSVFLLLLFLLLFL
jgi:hypothetical protein